MSRIEKLILISSFIFFCIPLFLTTSNDLTQDLGRHLLLGEIIAQTKQVPKTNLFSYTYPNYPFVNHHWLSEVILFVLKQVFGLHFLIFVKAACIILALLIVVLINRTFFSFILAFVLSFFLLERSDIRPEMFSYVIFSISLYLFFSMQKEKKMPVFFPLLFLFWVNIHISFVFGLVVLFFCGMTMQKNTRNMIIFLSCLLILVCNPNNLSGVLSPFTIFRNYGYPIVENQNMFFLMHMTNNIFIVFFFFLIPFLIIWISLLCFEKKWKEACMLLLFMCFPLLQIRHLPFFVFTTIAIVPRVSFRPRVLIGKTMRSVIFFGYVGILYFVSIFFWSNTVYEVFDMRKSVGFSYELENSDLPAYVRKKNLSYFFNNFDIGSFLIYSLYPQKVFVDGRPEAYPVSFFQSTYIPLQERAELQKEIFSRYHIRSIVVSHTDQTDWGKSFLKRISSDPGWKLTYIDSLFAVFINSQKEKDIRTNELFFKRMKGDNSFFHKIQYVSFLLTIGMDNEAQTLLRQASLERPHSCVVQRVKYQENAALIAPWCLLQTIKIL